jgi:DNA-directed RNA polymerase subunit M/transcription elongation factor TFIIS
MSNFVLSYYKKSSASNNLNFTPEEIKKFVLELSEVKNITNIDEKIKLTKDILSQSERDIHYISKVILGLDENIIEGYKCLKCLGNKVIRYQNQLRSGDEGATTINQCLTCKFEWV